MTAHKDIHITFQINGRFYEAVGFLEDWGDRISMEDAFRLVQDKNGGPIGEEDRFSKEDLEEAHPKLKKYFLITAIPCPTYKGNFLLFFYSLFDKEKRWYEESHFLPRTILDDQCLIVRRCR